MKIGNELLLLEGAKLKIEDFGVGSFAATPSYLIGVNSSGEAVEVDPTTYLSSVPTLQEVTDAGSTTTNAITLNRGTGTQSLILNHDTANNLSFNHYSAYSTLRDNTLSSNRILFHNSGETVISYALGVNLNGSSKPSAKLHVVGGGSTILEVENSGGDPVLQVEEDSVVISQNTANNSGGLVLKSFSPVYSNSIRSNSYNLELNAIGALNVNADKIIIKNPDTGNQLWQIGERTTEDEAIIVSNRNDAEIHASGGYGFWNIGTGNQFIAISKKAEGANGTGINFSRYDSSNTTAVISMVLAETGQLELKDYTSANFNSTPTSILGVDGSGNVVKTAASGFLTDVPTLQEVTDEGATTSNNLTIGNSTTGFSATFNRGLKVGSASGWAHYFSAGNANIIGDTTVIESSLLLSPNAPDATTTNFRFLNTNNKLTTATVVAGVTLSDKHFTIDSDGDIGMNTLSPIAKLHVVGGAVNSGNTILHIENGAGTDIVRVFDDETLSIQSTNFKVTSAGYTAIGGATSSSYAFINHLDADMSVAPLGRSLRFGSAITFTRTQSTLTHQASTGGHIFNTFRDGSTQESFHLKGDGQLKLKTYTSTTHDGTPTAILGVDGSGNVVKQSASNLLTSVPTLQEVTDAGNTTTNQITINETGVSRLKITESTLGIGGSTDGLDVMIDSGRNAYLWNRENGTLIFATNNIEAARFNESGDFGINTASPIAKLHVVGGGNTSSTIAFQVENNDGGDILYLRDDGLAQFHNAIKIVSEIPYLQLSDTTLGSNHYINSNNANLRIQSTGEIEIRPTQAEVARFTDKGLSINGVSSSSKLYVKGDGVLSTNFLVEDADGGTGFIVYNNHEVGIGTNVVASILHIKEDNGYVFSNAGLTLEQAGTGDCVMQYFLSDGSSSRWVTGIDNSDGDKFKIAQNTNLGSDTRLTIADGGNIGIGVTNPDAKLSIVSSSGADAFVAENNGGQEVLRAGLIAGDITTGGNQIFYQGVFSNNYTGDMDSFNGFRVGRFKGNGSLNQAFNAHHNVLNLPNDSASVYDIQLAFETTGGAVLNGGFKFRNSSNSNWSEWYTVYHSGNGQTYQDVIDASASSVSYPTIATTYTIITSDSDKDVISIDYKINDGTNYRTGTVTAITNGTTTSITDTTKAEIGDTSGAVFISDYSGSVLTIKVTTNDSGWDAKYIIKNF